MEPKDCPSENTEEEEDPVQEQVFDNLEQLHQTAMFITEAGLSI
jgi:hypothetical protein